MRDRVSVMEPGAQVPQTWPASAYSPTSQSAHATVDSALDCPASHAVQLVAAGAVRVSVMEPGAQA